MRSGGNGMWGRGPAQGKNNFKKIYIYGFHQIVKDYTDNQWEKIKCSVCVNSINMSIRKASPHVEEKNYDGNARDSVT